MLLLVRNGRMSGNLVVCVGRLRAWLHRTVELHTSSVSPHVLVLPWGAIETLCCVPKSMERLVLPSLFRLAPQRVARRTSIETGVPSVPPTLGAATLVHWRSIVLSDAESSAGVGSRPRSSGALCILSLETNDVRASSWTPCVARRCTEAMRCRRRGGMLPG